MTRRHITLERSKLYREVWSQPLTKLVAIYGLSSHQIKLYAVEMGIPLPPMGHWVKALHGKAAPTPPLPEGDFKPSCTHEIWVNEKEDEVERRMRIAIPGLPAVTLPIPEIAKNIDECLPIVRDMATRLATAYSDKRNWPRVCSPGLFEIAVSPKNQLRALLTLDRAIRHCNQCGLQVISAPKEDSPAYFNIYGMKLTLRIFEPGRRKERELTAAERKKFQKNPEYFYISNRYVFLPSNVLQLDVLQPRYNSPEFTIPDVTTDLFSKRIAELPHRLRLRALRDKLDDDIEREAEERANKRRQLLEEKAAVKRAQLDKLERVEKLADRYNRAAKLRSFARTLEACGRNSPAGTQTSLDWIRDAADWLDPTVGRHWPEVDDAGTLP